MERGAKKTVIIKRGESRIYNIQCMYDDKQYLGRKMQTKADKMMTSRLSTALASLLQRFSKVLLFIKFLRLTDDPACPAIDHFPFFSQIPDPNSVFLLFPHHRVISLSEALLYYLRPHFASRRFFCWCHFWNLRLEFLYCRVFFVKHWSK